MAAAAKPQAPTAATETKHKAAELSPAARQEILEKTMDRLRAALKDVPFPSHMVRLIKDPGDHVKIECELVPDLTLGLLMRLGPLDDYPTMQHLLGSAHIALKNLIHGLVRGNKVGIVEAHPNG